MPRQGKSLHKGTYAHHAITDVEGITIDYSFNPPRPSTNSLPQNGFEDNSAATVTFDELTRTITIAPTGTEYYVWSGGQQFKKTQAESIVIPDTEGLHYTIFNTDGELECTTTFDFETIIVQNAFVSALYWSVVDQEAVLLTNERHLRMDAETHGYLHQALGTQYISGLALGNIVADQNGNDDEDAQLSVANGVIRDEDIVINIVDADPQILDPIAEIPLFYRDGPTGNWRKFAATQFPVTNLGAGRARWNEFTGGSWQLTEVANNDFVLTHIFATSDERHPIIGIIGQEDYLTRGQAEAGAQVEINSLSFGQLELLAPEFKAIATVIFQTGNKTNQVQSSIESTEDGGDYVDWRTTGVGSGGTAATTTNHPDLLNRDLADQHPVTAITGLSDALVQDPTSGIWRINPAENLLINGCMDVTDRRGGTGNQAGTGLGPDRWYGSTNTAGLIRSVSGNHRDSRKFRMANSTAVRTGFNEYEIMQYIGIEGRDLYGIREIPLTLSFKAQNLGVDQDVSIIIEKQGASGTVRFKKVITLVASSTDVFYQVNIPAYTSLDTYLDTQLGMNVLFVLGYTVASGTGGVDDGWDNIGDPYFSPVDLPKPASSEIRIGQVKLEANEFFTGWIREDLEIIRRKCQRYWSHSNSSWGRVLHFNGDVSLPRTYYALQSFETQMRVTPTVVLTDFITNGFPLASGTASVDLNGIREARVASATATGRRFSSNYTANSDFI